MKVLMITHFTNTPDESGNNRFKYLAEVLSSFGKVRVITTTFSHNEKQQRKITKWNDINYEVQLCYEPGYSKNVCLKRFYSHYIFSKNLKKKLMLSEKPDVIYCSIPSLSAAVVAGKYAKKNKIKFILDIQDLWPEAFKMIFDLPALGKLIYLPFEIMANRAYKLADVTVAVSDTYLERGLKKNTKKNGVCVYLGTDLKGFDRNCIENEVKKKSKEIWLTYAGTLGHSYNLKIVIDALSKIYNENLYFIVLGDGPMRQEYEEYAREKNVRARFLGRVPYPKMCAYLKTSDIAVNPIAKGAAQSIINKHADYAAAGLAVVNTQENKEYRGLIEKYHCGINCGVDSVKDVENAIKYLLNYPDKRKTMGVNSRRMAEEKFDRSETYKKIVSLCRTEDLYNE